MAFIITSVWIRPSLKAHKLQLTPVYHQGESGSKALNDTGRNIHLLVPLSSREVCIYKRRTNERAKKKLAFKDKKVCTTNCMTIVYIINSTFLDYIFIVK